MSSRGTGRVYRPVNDRGQQSPFWSIAYSVGGKRFYEASKSKKKSDAQRLLRQRLDGREGGKIIGNPRSVTLAQLRGLVERAYALDGRKSVARVKLAFAHLEEYFGAKAKVAELGRAQFDSYAEQRLAAGRTRSTVNYELAALRRGYRLALESGLLGTVPVFKLPNPHNARSGFFEPEDFAALAAELPVDVGDLIEGLRWTGWRLNEMRLLCWANVDRDGGTIRLEGTRSKNGRPRVFPFGELPPLKALIEKRYALRDGLYVFHRNGKPLGYGAIRSAWRRATKRAGLAGKLVHDVRRSFARDMRRAGVSEGETLKLGGWETPAMLSRYSIISEGDLARAVAKRFQDSETSAKPNATEAHPDSVSSSGA